MKSLAVDGIYVKEMGRKLFVMESLSILTPLPPLKQILYYYSLLNMFERGNKKKRGLSPLYKNSPLEIKRDGENPE